MVLSFMYSHIKRMDSSVEKMSSARYSLPAEGDTRSLQA